MTEKKKKDDESKTDDKAARKQEQSEAKQERAEAREGTIADQDVQGTAPEVQRNYQGETDTNAGK